MLAPDGWNGGVQAGYNWQLAPQWLVGVEADIQFSAAKDGTDCNLPCGAPIGLTAAGGTRLFPVTFSENSVHSELNWFGTLRGRLAYAAGPALFYATGGLAYGEVSSNGRVAGAIIGALSGTQFSTFAGSFDASDARTGWTAGWGIEAQLGGNWSVKKEYLYLDLGTSTNTFNAVFLPGSTNTGVATSHTVNEDIRQHVFRTGLNYKFGGPAAPIAPYNWAGFYIGANGGYSVGTHKTNVVAIAGPNLNVPAGTLLYGGPQDFMLAPDGWNGGGQIGYNWHVMPQWVAGIEADLQLAKASDRVNCYLPCGTTIALTTATGVGTPGATPVVFSEASVESKLDWFGTLRARVGRASGPAFFYFTGGLAYGEVSSSARVAGRTIGVILGGTINTFAGSYDTSETKIGWTLGSGLEAQLAGNWSLKTEYLYVDLGTVENTFNTIFLTPGGLAGDLAVTRTVSTEIKEHIFRAGLNYKFGAWGKGPVVSRY